MVLYGLNRLLKRVRQPWVRLAALLLLCLALGAAAVLGVTAYRFSAAQKAVASGDLEQARRHLRWCLAVSPANIQTRLLAARVERVDWNLKGAQAHLEECNRLERPTSEPVQLEWVLLRAQQGEVDAVAPGLWNCIYNDHPETPAIFETLARAYIYERRLRTALECLNQWLERLPDSPRALEWRGWIHHLLENRDAAVADYRRALEVAPDWYRVRLRLVEILLDDSNLPEARPHLDVLVRTRSGLPEVTVLLARARLLEGNTADARRLFDEAYAAAPQHLAGLLYRGMLELQDDRPAEAEVWLRRALERDPASLEARHNLSLSLARAGRTEAARAELERAKTIKAELERLRTLVRAEGDELFRNPDRAAEVGEICLKHGQTKVGLHWLYKVLTRHPHHARTHEVLASHFEQAGQPQEAAKHREFVSRGRASAPGSAESAARATAP